MNHAAYGGSARRRRGRAVHGVLLLDKTSGITSSAVVQNVRRLFHAQKAGHTGTLDPMASGLLPICLGEATKFSHLLLGADKTYIATVRLGVTTTTGDLEGKITSQRAVEATPEDIAQALKAFSGEILQTPPMYSALKHGGQRLYKLARAGTEVARAPRSIFIHRLDLLGVEGEELRLFVSCSKGTYLRVLAEDLGRVLGCGACLSGLRREGVGTFRLSGGAFSLDQIERMAPGERDALLLPADALVLSLPRLDLDPESALRLSHGQRVAHCAVQEEGLARIYAPGGIFLGVAEVKAHGQIVPRRLVSRAGGATVDGTSIA